MDAFLDNLPGDLGRKQKRRRRKKTVHKNLIAKAPFVPVIFHVVKCPNCESKECPVVHTARPIRYHKCRGCGMRFKSVEA